MIGVCAKSNTRRKKLKGKRKVYHHCDSRQELRSCICSRISQAANGVHSAVVLYWSRLEFSAESSIYHGICLCAEWCGGGGGIFLMFEDFGRIFDN